MHSDVLDTLAEYMGNLYVKDFKIMLDKVLIPLKK